MPIQDLVTPDSSKAPGTPPVNGTGGERGTSAFAGNDEFTAYNPNGGTVLRPDVIPSEGPLRGTQYYNDPTKNRGDAGMSVRFNGDPTTFTAQDPSGAANAPTPPAP